MHLKRVIKVVLPLGLLLLLGPQEPIIDWPAQWTQVTGTGSELLRQPAARNAGNAAPPLDSNNIFSQLPDKAAALWVPSGKGRVGPLHGIDALSPNDIWAVGETLDRPSKALVAHWGGMHWSTTTTFAATKFEDVRVLNPGTRLYDVAALAPDDVWVVGEYHTLVSPPIVMDNICCWRSNVVIAHWDGKSWQVVPPPQIERDNKVTDNGWYSPRPDSSGAYGGLRAITAVAKDDVWAVGQSGERQTLIMHWDGKSWQVVDGPDDLEEKSHPLNDIIATSANDIWAAGNDTIIHWNGKKWHEVYKRGLFSGGRGFQSIIAITPDDVWAFGSDRQVMGSGDFSLVYAVHWDGKAWAYTPLLTDRPRMSGALYGGGYTLSGAVAVSQDDVWAVGGSRHGALVMHWNGRAWSVHNCPAKGLSGAGALSDVIVTARGEVWTVGGEPNEWGQADPTSGFVMRLGVGACPATPVPVPPSGPVPLAPPSGPDPSTLVPPWSPSNLYVPPTSVPRDNYLLPPALEQEVAPTPVQTQPGPVRTSIPAPEASVGVTSGVTPARP